MSGTFELHETASRNRSGAKDLLKNRRLPGRLLSVPAIWKLFSAEPRKRLNLVSRLGWRTKPYEVDAANGSLAVTPRHYALTIHPKLCAAHALCPMGTRSSGRLFWVGLTQPRLEA